MSDMLNQIQSNHADAKNAARAAAVPEDPPAPLPPGSEPVEDVEDKTEPIIQVPAEAPKEGEPPAEKPVEEAETLIRIGSQTFKNQADAIRYAEQLEQEKLIAEAHQMGVREALAATQAPAAPPPEEDFDTEFYKDPKAMLTKIKEQAKNEALGAVNAERAKEQLWKTFEEKYPDIDRKDAELMLMQNMDSIGKMTQIDKAMEVLAQRTRAEYQRIVDRMKPRTELHPSKGASTIRSSSSSPSVTPQKKEEPVLTMAQQLSTVRAAKRNIPA